METVLVQKDNKQKLFEKVSDYFECFLVYCFLGWVYESIWCDVIYHKRGFLNRGVLFGPWLPIYGIGFFIILGIITFLKIKKPLHVFVFGSILATLSELVASYVLEATMGNYMWNYTGYFLNFDSRIALVPGLMFGLLIWVAICKIHPAIMRFQNKHRASKIHKICFITVTALFFLDLISRLWLGSNFKG